MSTAAGIAALSLAFPPSQFSEEKAAFYARMLRDLPEDMTVRAIERIIKRSRFLPSIGEIREEVSEERLGLPTVEEAWDIATRGDLRAAPEEVRQAALACGGRWNIMHSESPEVVRSQFTKDYMARRARSIQTDAGAVAPSNVVDLLPHRLDREIQGARALPETTRIQPRPVMLRMMRRNAGRVLAPPDDPERGDAIRVLAEGEQADPLMWVEAQRILDEATLADEAC